MPGFIEMLHSFHYKRTIIKMTGTQIVNIQLLGLWILTETMAAAHGLWGAAIFMHARSEQ